MRWDHPNDRQKTMVRTGFSVQSGPYLVDIRETVVDKEVPKNLMIFEFRFQYDIFLGNINFPYHLHHISLFSAQIQFVDY